MEIQFFLNGQSVKTEIQADTLLLDLVRAWMLQCQTWL